MQIFPNGTITFNLHTEDLDENGLPVAASERKPDPIQCTISTIHEDRRGLSDGVRYRNCTYSVTCNMEDFESRPALFDLIFTFSFRENYSDAVTLSHDRKGVLGTFPIQRIEYYEITGTVEIWL